MVHVSMKPLAKANASGFVDYCKRLHFFYGVRKLYLSFASPQSPALMFYIVMYL